MCRVIALPPNTSKIVAKNLLKNLCVGNSDGVGSVYVKDGEFIVNKYPTDYDTVAEKKLPLLDHMPYNGWTLVHVRAASHGKNTFNNTHPFVTEDFAMIHNGIFREWRIAKALLKDNTFKGQTDSEVAARVWETIGRKKFLEILSSGVFMFLNRRGQLDVICCEGNDLAFKRTDKGILLASEFQGKRGVVEVQKGAFRLSRTGKFLSAEWERREAYICSYQYNGASCRKIKLNDLSNEEIWCNEFSGDNDAT